MKNDVRFRDGRAGAALAVKVIPRARQNEIIDISSEGSIRIRLNASTDHEDLNRCLVTYLSRVLSVREMDIEVVAGRSNKSKLVAVVDLSKKAAHERIIQNLS